MLGGVCLNLAHVNAIASLFVVSKTLKVEPTIVRSFMTMIHVAYMHLAAGIELMRVKRK